MPDINSELLAMMQGIRQTLQKQSQIMNAWNSSISHSTTGLDYNNEKQREHAAEIAKEIKTIAKGRQLNEKQLELAEKVRAAKKKELELDYKIRKQREHAAKMEREHGAQHEFAKKSREQLTHLEGDYAEAQKQTIKSSSKLSSSFIGVVKGVDLAGIAFTAFGVALRGQVKQLVDQYKTTGGVMEGSGNLFTDMVKQQQIAFSYGLSGSQLMEISKQSRQTVNAMGGTEAAFNQMSPTIDRLRILTGSSAQAVKEAAKAAEYFTHHGVKPSQQAMSQYTDSLVEMNKYAGMNTEQAAAYFNEIANDADSIELLRKSRASERESILANQRALVQQSLALGMSAEQAKEAAKMLNKMVAAKPLDRIKQAAKMRALGGALGISGADEAAKGVVAGSRATDEQKRAMMEFSQKAATALDGAAQQGLGPEIFASTLAEKLDLEKYLGQGSPFSTSLTDATKPLKESMDKLYDVSKTKSGAAIGKGIEYTDKFNTLISGQNIYGVLITGLLTGITLLLSRGKLLEVFGGALEKFGGKFGGKLASKLLGKGAEAAGRAPNIARTLASGTRFSEAAEVGANGSRLGSLVRGSRALLSRGTGLFADGVGAASRGIGGVAKGAGGLLSRGAGFAADGLGAAANGIGAATKGIGGLASKGLGALGGLGNVAKVLGKFAAVIDVGSGVYDLSQGKKKEKMEGLDYLSPMSYGMRIGEGINKLFEGQTGKSIGSAIYDVFNSKADNDIKKMLQGGTPSSPKVVADNSAKKDAKEAERLAKAATAPMQAIADATKTTTDGQDSVVSAQDQSTQAIKDIHDTVKDMAKPVTQMTPDDFRRQEKSSYGYAMPGTTTTPVDTTDTADQATVSASDDASKDIAEATKTTADGVTEQVKKMDESNTILQRLADISDKHTELLEKQLLAMTLSDKEKENKATTDNFRKDNRFAAQYGYI